MYKEKYLKYKTKYLDLKSQEGSVPNILQEGGYFFWEEKNEKKAREAAEAAAAEKAAAEKVAALATSNIQNLNNWQHVINNLRKAQLSQKNPNNQSVGIGAQMEEASRQSSMIPWSPIDKYVDEWNIVVDNIKQGPINYESTNTISVIFDLSNIGKISKYGNVFFNNNEYVLDPSDGQITLNDR